MRKRKVVIVSTFSGPLDGAMNNRFVYLAEILSVDYEVVLLTTNFYHSKKEIIEQKFDFKKIQVEMLEVPCYKSNISALRLWSHLVFSIKTFVYLRRFTTIDDIVYCAFPPVSVGVFSYLATKDPKRFILDIQDLWPEVFYSSKKLKPLKPFFGLHRFLVKWLAKRVVNLVAVSETYLNHFKQKGFKGSKELAVYIGVAGGLVDSVKEKKRVYNSTGEVVRFIYAGTLGHSYNLSNFIISFSEAEKGLCDGFTIELVILGSGPLEKKLRDLVLDLNTNVKIIGRVPFEEVLKELSISDVAVNSVAAGMQQSIINKHGDYTLMGLPILSTQDNVEFTNLVDTFGIGVNVDPANNKEIAKAIITLAENKTMRMAMAKNSKNLGQQKFDRRNSYHEIKEMIHEL